MTFGGGLASDGEPTSEFFKLQKIRTQKKCIFYEFSKPLP